ncbi:hypothetical protein CSUI_006283 [Cystoisospora suis]|uniref:Uncharacterized protein n=1 Tax=Cystoisospora suis TaxID=483139 RepID=A0A2C6KQV9_9APIC|nr:hypothetical protein CSUI_006283 [Cystoisospora suis]
MHGPSERLQREEAMAFVNQNDCFQGSAWCERARPHATATGLRENLVEVRRLNSTKTDASSAASAADVYSALTSSCPATRKLRC